MQKISEQCARYLPTKQQISGECANSSGKARESRCSSSRSPGRHRRVVGSLLCAALPGPSPAPEEGRRRWRRSFWVRHVSPRQCPVLLPALACRGRDKSAAPGLSLPTSLSPQTKLNLKPNVFLHRIANMAGSLICFQRINTHTSSYSLLGMLSANAPRVA
jgi:hypothetical protein